MTVAAAVAAVEATIVAVAAAAMTVAAAAAAAAMTVAEVQMISRVECSEGVWLWGLITHTRGERLSVVTVLRLDCL
jgi:hypothetical protein